MIDHDAASQALIARVFDGQSEGLTRDDILDNVSLYWLFITTASRKARTSRRGSSRKPSRKSSARASNRCASFYEGGVHQGACRLCVDHAATPIWN